MPHIRIMSRDIAVAMQISVEAKKQRTDNVVYQWKTAIIFHGNSQICWRNKDFTETRILQNKAP